MDKSQQETPEQITVRKKAEERFKQDLLVRKEAVEVDGEDNLPPGATHVVKKTSDGTINLKRKRFSAY